MAGKYVLKYEDEQFGSEVTHVKDYNKIDSETENLDNILNQFSIFINAITFNTFALLDTNSIEEYEYLLDKQAEFRRDNPT